MPKNDDFEDCYISIHPQDREICAVAAEFFRDHWRSWEALTGEKSLAKAPNVGRYKTPLGVIPTIEFHYSVDIEEHEQQYVTTLAQWTSLKIGSRGKVTLPGGKHGRPYGEPVTYKVPFVYYDGYEKWALFPREEWEEASSPEDLGIGTLVDAEGFTSRSKQRHRQKAYHVHEMNGVLLPAAQREMAKHGRYENLISSEMLRLSELW